MDHETTYDASNKNSAIDLSGHITQQHFFESTRYRWNDYGRQKWLTRYLSIKSPVALAN